MQTAELPLRLPGLNEYQKWCRTSPILGAQHKKSDKQTVMAHLGGLRPAKWPINLSIFFVEPNKKRDKDNVSAYGAKVICDALVSAGIIPDDNSNYITALEMGVLYEEGQSKIIIGITEKDDPDYIGDDSERIWAAAAKFFENSAAPKRPPTVEELLEQNKGVKRVRKKKDGDTLPHGGRDLFSQR